MVSVGFAVLTLFARSSTASELTLAKGTAPGSFQIQVNSVPWFDSGSVAVTVGHVTYSSSDGSLKPDGPAVSAKGSDALGAFASMTQAWKAAATPFVTSTRLYTAGNVAVFEQVFPEGAAGTNISSVEVRADARASRSLWWRAGFRLPGIDCRMRLRAHYYGESGRSSDAVEFADVATRTHVPCMLCTPYADMQGNSGNGGVGQVVSSCFPSINTVSECNECVYTLTSKNLKNLGDGTAEVNAWR